MGRCTEHYELNVFYGFFVPHDGGSSNELMSLIFYGVIIPVEWTCWDLNPGPPPCKGGDLPTDLQAPIAGAFWPVHYFYDYRLVVVFRVFLAVIGQNIAFPV
jgi:hypothetical protein